MLLSPAQIISSFERGEIEREEMHSLMALHARELIREAEEDSQNSATAWIEALRVRRAAGRLVRRHSRRLIREILVALADVRDFPPAYSLWNASHPDMPLHAFFRIKRKPLFRILTLETQENGDIHLVTEHSEEARGNPLRRSFLLKRDECQKLYVQVN